MYEMRIVSWDDFAQRAKKMYLDEPLRTRYIVRYSHSQGKFCAKVTDDLKVGCFQHVMGALVKMATHCVSAHAVHPVQERSSNRCEEAG